MGALTKRRASQLPKLIERLEVARSKLAERELPGEDDENVRTAALAQRQRHLDNVDLTTSQAREYLSEFEQTGSIEDPRFDAWFKNAKGAAYIFKRVEFK